MQFEVLGPIRVLHDGMVNPVSGGLRQALVAMLLANRNEPVPVDALLQALWGPDWQPRGPQKLQVHIHRLRSILDDPDRLQLSPGGYRLCVRPGELDSERFGTSVDEACAIAADEPQRCVALLRKALNLWRGTPFHGVDVPALDGEINRLSELHVTALETLYGAELECGRHAEVLPELAELVRQNPLRERSHGLYVTALARAGRRAEALAAYQSAKDTIADELGIDPGHALRQVHERVLADDVPTQLPHGVATFVGRDAELSELSVAVNAGLDAAPVVVISGMAGVGKTALALRWAHRAAANYPDGQLYVDLSGFGAGEPVSAQHALAGFLRALGVDGALIPASEAERAATFRSLVTGRRILMILDNAASVDQVRPLLPATSSCTVVVTSRARLLGLAAREGAQRIDLGPMSASDSERLFAALIDADTGIERDQVLELVNRCARLPLALRVAAERVRERFGSGLAEVVADLADEHHALDTLNAGDDRSTSVRAVLSWSYRQLEPALARAFRYCGIHPGQQLDSHAFAALLGVDEPRAARRLLDSLAGANLADHTATGRYQLHDLLRMYAAELAHELDPYAQRRAALARLANYYLATASHAVDIVVAEDDELRPTLDLTPVQTPTFRGYAEAFHWLDRERASMLSLLDRLEERDLHWYAPMLSAVLTRYLSRELHIDEALRLHEQALALARERQDEHGAAQALEGLGVASYRLGCYEQAEAELLCATELFARAGATGQQASALSGLACVDFAAGRPEQAVARLRESVRLFDEMGCQLAPARPLANLGFVYWRQGLMDQAAECLERARAIGDAQGSRFRRLHALLNLARIYRDGGQAEKAFDCAADALAIARASGWKVAESEVSTNLATIFLQLGDGASAIRQHGRALALARSLPNGGTLVAEALNGLGEAHQVAGRYEYAVRYHWRALPTAVDAKSYAEQARAHRGLGDALAGVADYTAARDHWRRALACYRELHDPAAADVWRRLNRR